MACSADFEVIDTGMEGPEVLVFTVGSDEFLETFTNVIKEWQTRDGIVHIPSGLRFPTLVEARNTAAGAFGPHPRQSSSRRHADGTWEPLL